MMQAYYFDTVESTNDLAKSMLREGKIAGASYLVARAQTAGRGNRGRTWLSPRDAGIYLSVIDWSLSIEASILHEFTRSAAIACAEVLEAQAGIAVVIKPINDLYVDGRKLGGILTEAVIEGGKVCALITGVGINVRKADRRLPSDHVCPTCLEELMGPNAIARFEIREFTAQLAHRIHQWNAVVARGDLATLGSHWEKYVVAGALPMQRGIQ